MRVAVAVTCAPFRPSPDRARAAALCAALRAAGAEAELVAVPFSAAPPLAAAPQLLACRLLDLSESMGTRIDRLVATSPPAGAIPHPHKTLWHGVAPAIAPGNWPGTAETRAVMQRATRQSAAESQAVFATSRFAAGVMAQRLEVEARTLYEPPPLAHLCRSDPAADYVLAEGCGPRPRLDMLLDAAGHTRLPVRLVAVAPHWAPEDRARAEQAAPGRVTLEAAPDASRLASLLAAARAVLIASQDSDDTGTALAAMLCARPLIVPSDAGAPVEFVQHGQAGLICAPAAASLADALDTVWGDELQARALGNWARLHYQELAPSWETVAQCLLASG